MLRPSRSHVLLPAMLLATLALAGAGCVDDVPAHDDDALEDPDHGKADEVALDPPGCAFDSTDPFEPRERIPQGKYKGRCYDTRQHRPVVRLDASRAAAYGGAPSANEIVLANVFHDGRFWVARVPLDSVETAVFQLEYFPAIVPAGHTQLRVRFAANAPVRLYGQTPRDKARRAELRDLVFSIEALGQRGYRYDVVRGLVNDFGAVYRVTSLEARVDSMIVRQGHEVEQWSMSMLPGETRRLLVNYAEESDTRDLQVMYNTLFVNCTNELVRIIDRSVDYGWGEQVGRVLAKVTEFYPNVIRTALIARGLLPLDQSSDWPRLADDPTIADMLARLRAR